MVKLNPASMINAKTYLDINLAGGGAFINNNLVNYSNTSVIGLIKDRSLPLFYSRIVQNQGIPIQIFAKGFVSGPVGTWNQGDHAIGLAFNYRAYGNLENAPSFIGNFIDRGISGDHISILTKPYSAKNIQMGQMSFAEIQASYAYTFLKKGKNLLSVGVSIKKFYSVQAKVVNVYDADFGFNIDSATVAKSPSSDPTTIALHSLNADYMTASSGDKLYSKKGGMGFDIGFTYQRTLSTCNSYLPHTAKSSCRYIPYKYKIGVSIIDIGAVKFDATNVNFKGFHFGETTLPSYTIVSKNMDSVLTSESGNSDLSTGRVAIKNKVQLPTYFSAQFDYNIWASALYINASIIQGIPHSISKFGVKQASSLSITPRFETRLFDIALPFSLYEYKDPQLGLSLRLGPLTVGTDKFINWFFNVGGAYGADIYVFLKVPMVYHPKCKEMILNKRGKGGDFKSKINCAF